MEKTVLYSLGSVLAVSLMAFAGLFTISLRQTLLRRIIFVLISFSVGALLGDVFLHILPEIVETGGSMILAMWYLFLGFLLFFVLEKILRWHHSHHHGGEDDPSEPEHHRLTHVGYLNLVSDALHNFVDGAVIAGSYLVSVPLGLSTTLAVFLHEIPQEVGDFGLLLHAGFSRGRALFWNFCSALGALLGAGAVLLVSSETFPLASFLLPVTAGGFIYIAAADLVPELHKVENLWKSFLQLVAIVMGFGLMALLLLLE